jgi:hypothetical protein
VTLGNTECHVRARIHISHYFARCKERRKTCIYWNVNFPRPDEAILRCHGDFSPILHELSRGGFVFLSRSVYFKEDAHEGGYIFFSACALDLQILESRGRPCGFAVRVYRPESHRSFVAVSFVLHMRQVLLSSDLSNRA